MLHINSRFRQYGTASSFTISVPSQRKIKVNGELQKHTVTLKDATIPLTMYNITTRNNKIVFNEGGANLVALITPGIYDIDGLLPAIKATLDAAGALTYTCTDSSGRILISATGNFQLLWEQATASYRLGWGDEWEGARANKALNTALYTYHLAPQPYNLSPPNSLYLSMSGFPLCEKATTQPANFTFSLAMGANSYAVGSTSTQLVHENVDLSNSTMRITLMDDIGYELEGLCDWTMTLGIE